MSEKNQESLLSLTERLQVWIKNKYVVEVITAEKEITGVLTETGIDYILISSEREQSIETESIDQDGKTEKEQHTIVHELETLLKLKDIIAISRVLQFRYK